MGRDEALAHGQRFLRMIEGVQSVLAMAEDIAAIDRLTAEANQRGKAVEQAALDAEARKAKAEEDMASINAAMKAAGERIKAADESAKAVADKASADADEIIARANVSAKQIVDEAKQVAAMKKTDLDRLEAEEAVLKSDIVKRLDELASIEAKIEAAKQAMRDMLK